MLTGHLRGAVYILYIKHCYQTADYILLDPYLLALKINKHNVSINCQGLKAVKNKTQNNVINKINQIKAVECKLQSGYIRLDEIYQQPTNTCILGKRGLCDCHLKAILQNILVYTRGTSWQM